MNEISQLSYLVWSKQTFMIILLSYYSACCNFFKKKITLDVNFALEFFLEKFFPQLALFGVFQFDFYFTIYNQSISIHFI